MKPFCRMLAVVVLGSASALAFAGTEKADIARLVSTGREESQVMEHLDILTNRIGPRLTSSDNLQNACEWARDRFKSFGIENARLEKWGEYPVGFNRGPWFGRMVAPTEKSLTFGTNSWTAGTKGLVKGKAILAPTNDEELAKVKDKLPGAWVLTTGAPVRANRPADPFAVKLQAAYKEAKVAGLIRSTSNDLILTGGDYKITWDALPTIPGINLLKAQFAEISGLLKEGKPVELEFDIRNHFKKGPIPLYNVVADIIGTEFPDEYVIVGGHIDSWDGATGATDNGTGCATTLEAARLIMKAGIKPRRTIRFMLWSGEEQGLMGSEAYVKAHPDLIKKVSAVLVHDGGTNYLSGIGVTKAMKKDIEEAFAPVMGLDTTMPFAIREVPGLRAAGGSDHVPFIAAGAPGFFWNQADTAKKATRYNITHHTQHDTYERAVPEYQKHSSIVAALGSLGIANLDHLLSREALIAPGGAGGGRGRMGMGLMLEEMKVTEIVEDSPGGKAGFKAGDVIIKVDGKPVADRMEFFEAIMAGGPSKKIVVKRDGKEVELAVTMPASP
jgi:carboxypeptidase Q